jgi:hypothetical protein
MTHSMPRKEHDAGCPLHAIDQRLEDLHRQWHDAERAYFDPDAFRVAIQTAIQTLRTVTFILQSNKRLIPDFDAWYGGWRAKLAADPLMRWMQNARNKIEKEGDLEAHSMVRAEIIASYLEGQSPRIEVPAKLFDSPAALLKGIPTAVLRDHVMKHGILRIERRWVENTLPDHELLDAVAIAYGRVAEIVHDAHRQLGLPLPQTTNVDTGQVYSDEFRGGRMPCMIGHAERRSLDVSLATGKPVQLETIEKSIDVSERPGLEKRYGLIAKDMYGDGKSPENTVRAIFVSARRMFMKDRHHVTIMFFLKGTVPIHFAQLNFEGQADKYLMMRKMADEAAKIGADGVVLVGEVWTAPADPTHPYRRAAEAPNRTEALIAVLVTKDAEPLQLSAEIKRGRWGKLTLGPDNETGRGAQFSFAPFYKVWGKPIPEAWQAADPVAQAEQPPAAEKGQSGAD